MGLVLKNKNGFATKNILSCLTFLENTKIRGIQDLVPLAVPSDLQRSTSADPALQNHHLALRCLRVLQELHRGRIVKPKDTETIRERK